MVIFNSHVKLPEGKISFSKGAVWYMYSLIAGLVCLPKWTRHTQVNPGFINLWLISCQKLAENSYPLVMTNSSPWYRWPIEINGLPFSKMGGSFHGELLNNQMVSCFFDVESEVPFFLEV